MTTAPATLEQLRQLVMALERRIAELERRIAELERRLAAAPSRPRK